MPSLRTVATRTVRRLQRLADHKLHRIYSEFADFTMNPRDRYVDNLKLVSAVTVPGAIVECGTWRGGMSAGMARVLGPDRVYVLFDSFEGLPAATELDGQAAIAWQADVTGHEYFDNCTADASFARDAMNRSGVFSAGDRARLVREHRVAMGSRGPPDRGSPSRW